MKRSTTLVAALVALPLALSLASCEQDKKEAEKNAKTPCGSEFSATAATPLPSDVPGPSDRVVYSYAKQGKTQDWFATTAGTRDSIVSVRDAIKDQLTGAGYTITKTDQEKTVEAEGYFTGPHSGSIQVQVACEGKLRIRYRLES